MMYAMRRKPESTLLLIQGIFNISHHIGMVLEQRAFDGTVCYTQWGNVIAVPGIRTPVPSVNYSTL